MATVHSFALAAASRDTSENGDQKEENDRKDSASDINFIWGEKIFNLDMHNVYELGLRSCLADKQCRFYKNRTM